MLRVMLVLGLLVLVPAVIVFWRTRDRSTIDSAVATGTHGSSSKPVGTSTVSHGNPPPRPPAGRGRTAVSPSDSFDHR